MKKNLNLYGPEYFGDDDVYQARIFFEMEFYYDVFLEPIVDKFKEEFSSAEESIEPRFLPTINCCYNISWKGNIISLIVEFQWDSTISRNKALYHCEEIAMNMTCSLQDSLHEFEKRPEMLRANIIH